MKKRVSKAHDEGLATALREIQRTKGDTPILNEVWAAMYDRGFHLMLLKKFGRKYPQWQSRVDDVHGHAVLILRRAALTFNPDKAKVTSWNNLMQMVHLIGNRDLRRAMAKGGDGGALDIPQRAALAGASQIDVAYGEGGIYLMDGPAEATNTKPTEGEFDK